MKVQSAKWYANADQIAALLGRINPYWSQEVWRSLLYDHLRMTQDEAVQYLQGQYAASIKQYDAIQREVLQMADVMTCGILRQFQL